MKSTYGEIEQMCESVQAVLNEVFEKHTEFKSKMVKLKDTDESRALMFRAKNEELMADFNNIKGSVFRLLQLAASGSSEEELLMKKQVSLSESVEAKIAGLKDHLDLVKEKLDVLNTTISDFIKIVGEEK